MENYAELMFHEAVADLQKAEGTYERYQKMYPRRAQDALSPDDIAFIQSRQSFYMASVNPDGWPYVQHRGGEAGFVRVIGPSRIACADYRGNRQYISQGNLAEDNRVSLFFIDYAAKARLKVQGRATLVPLAEARDLSEQVVTPGLPAERILTVDIVAMDWNCPQYIPALYPEALVQTAIARAVAPLQAEIEELRARLAEKG